MKKRILSIVLCLVMVMGLLPMQAHAGDAQECLGCSHIHWDEAICDGCGLCSADCPKSDSCWYDTHCKNCGGCYMSADNWCDECGWCQDCMENEAHCRDCGRCFVGESKEELCEDCQRCADCVGEGGICEECNKCNECAGEEHCPNCLTEPTHLDGSEPCGYCDDCAEELGLHCAECHACLEGEVDRCPVHEDGDHCEEHAGFICEQCERCEYEDHIEECNVCEVCTECCVENSMDAGCYTGEVCIESSDWEGHLCKESDCGNCACLITICDTCGKCANCCAESECSCGCECTKKEISYDHDHKYKEGVYDRDKDGHWQICLICKEGSAHEVHACTAASSVCQVCGWDTEKTLFFVIQPKDAVAKVSYDDAPEGSDDHPAKNTVTFSVTAVNQAGNSLTYQWHEVCKDKKTGGIKNKKMLMDGGEHIVVSGATTNELTVSVPIDACFYNYEYYCTVTSKDTSGTVIQETSNSAKLRALHNYGELKPSDLSEVKNVEITWDDDDSKDTGTFKMGSKYHNNECLGLHCERTKLPAKTRHTFTFDRYVGYGSYTGQTAKYYFYIWKCGECGYEELRHSTKRLTPADYIYSITIVDTKGAYIWDTDDITRATAKLGEKLFAIAPAKDAFGNALKEWTVVDAPDGFTITQYVDGGGIVPGCGVFTMPAGNIKLKAVYYTGTDSKAATGIEIQEGLNMGYGPINESLTIEAGDEIVLHAKLTPETGLASDMVVWDVLSCDTNNPQLVFEYPFAASDENETTSVPLSAKTKNPKLTSKAPGTVRVRATTLDSGGKVYDTITVKILPSPTSEEPGHEKHTFPGGGTKVKPTCTKSGYTLHQCAYSGCEVQYRSDFVNPTGHKDENNDGFCDICNAKLPGSGNTSMVGRKKIKKVELTVAAPVRGGEPATTATPTGDEKDHFNAPGVDWDPFVTNTFDGGTKYSVLIKLEAKGDYGFKLDGAAEITNTQFYINGNKATVVYKDSQEASITYEFPATGTASSGSGSSTGSTAYTVTVLDGKNGAVTADRKSAAKGTTVTLTVSPDKGYTLETLTVLDKNGKQIKCTEKNGRYTFTMPASNVTVKATFLDDNTMPNFFVDVKAGDYYYDAVLWVAENGITGGTDATHFTPSGICTRAQAVTFLWRAAGSPEPKSSDMPFTDVPRGSYYETAVLWAVENGITRGTSDTTFSPEETCTRAQIVTFLWRSRKFPAAGGVNPFTDVKSDAYYTDAVLWAVKESVTSGTTAATFSPDENCTRAQIVTFIYRAREK